MALVYDNSLITLGLHGWVNKVQHAISSLFVPPSHSPEADLLGGAMRDARLVPRAPMSNANIDVGLLGQLSSIGLKRAKEVTDQSHPELMQAWRLMAQRAGLAKAPQLIIAESPSLNALTINKDEVTITTGLLRILDLRETTAVLGHELGHVQSEHIMPRLVTTALFGGAGALYGNELARRGTFGAFAERMASKWEPTRKAFAWLHPHGTVSGPSVLGGAIAIGSFASVGAMVGRHFSVRPTELDADAKGAAISGDPIGLAMALNQLQTHAKPNAAKQMLAQIQSGYPSTDKRIAALQELGQRQPMVPVLAELEARQAQTAAPAQPAAGQPRVAVSEITGAERVGEISGPALA